MSLEPSVSLTQAMEAVIMEEMVGRDCGDSHLQFPEGVASPVPEPPPKKLRGPDLILG